MAVIGNSSTQQAFTPAVDYFSGNASTTAFTLSRPVASVAQVQVVVNNVAQNPSSAYTISSNTITFTSAPSSGTNNIYVYYTSPITQVIAPGQGTVNTTALGNITNIASGNSSLTLQTGSSPTTAVTVDTSQNVGIGQTPTYKLDVLGSTTRIYNDSATLLLQRPSNSRSGQILINNANGGIKYYAGSNGSGENSVVAHEFTSDAPSTGTVLARINSYGIGLGANTPSSGTGITFPATQSASSDANTLDDYEEGTWTPTGGSLTVNVTGTYTKVGRFVYATYDFTFPGGGAGTQAVVGGLPFTVLTPGGGGSIGYTTYSTTITVNIERSSTNFTFYGSSGSVLTFANLNGVRFLGSLAYAV